MILLQNLKAIAVNNSVPFQAVAGTPPYVYAVAGGGAGGSISPTGLYTAPNITGTDIITVTDATLAVVSAEIAILSPIQLLCDIIKQEMGLADDQIFLYKQKFTVPNDARIYIAVGVLSDKAFANSRAQALSGGFKSEQSINVRSTLSVDIMGRTTEALDRKEEIILALNSIYAQTQQEANSFHIARIASNFVNLSDEDGAAIPYRFNISVNIQYAVKKGKVVDYYDTFAEPEVNTNK